MDVYPMIHVLHYAVCILIVILITYIIVCMNLPSNKKQVIDNSIASHCVPIWSVCEFPGPSATPITLQLSSVLYR